MKSIVWMKFSFALKTKKWNNFSEQDRAKLLRKLFACLIDTLEDFRHSGFKISDSKLLDSRE